MSNRSVELDLDNHTVTHTKQSSLLALKTYHVIMLCKFKEDLCADVDYNRVLYGSINRFTALALPMYYQSNHAARSYYRRKFPVKKNINAHIIASTRTRAEQKLLTLSDINILNVKHVYLDKGRQIYLHYVIKCGDAFQISANF
jgi:hypothetical protein